MLLTALIRTTAAQAEPLLETCHPACVYKSKIDISDNATEKLWVASVDMK